MKFAAAALVAAASVATATAALSTVKCETANFKPWISSPDVTLCTKDIAPYKLYPAFLPNATTYSLFCKSKNCAQVVYNTLAVRPASGDCFYKVEGTDVNLFETLVDDAVKVCGLTVTQAPTSAPPTSAPPTTAPVPTSATPITVPPTPTTTPPTPTRPACA